MPCFYIILWYIGENSAVLFLWMYLCPEKLEVCFGLFYYILVKPQFSQE